MHLGKITLSLIVFIVIFLSGCDRGDGYTDYSTAKTLFKIGMDESTVIETFGEPNNILNSGGLTGWFYDHEEIVKGLEVGEIREGFLIDFENGKSIGISPILVSKR